MPNNKKILCLGNNTEDTDIRARKVANEHAIQYNGLLTQVVDILSGCYQTSFYDISYGDLLILSNQFDEIIILDQKKESYLDEHGFYQTISLGKYLNQSKKVTFLNQSFNYTIADVLKENKSLCILPFIQSVAWNDENHACCRSKKILSKFDQLLQYSADPNRNQLKDNMIQGVMVPEYCHSCYELEQHSIISPRISETVEWTDRLNIKKIEEIANIKSPVFYEIRPSNQCNLMCRTCNPGWSSLINKENQILNIFPQENFKYNNFKHVDITKIQKLYVAGGEPTISSEFFDFLQSCIDYGNTDFEILINTNAVNLSTKFKKLISQFSNVAFEISVDGYREVNQYVRWPTNWDKLVSNINYIQTNGYKFSFNCVVSIYTISRLDQLIQFLSTQYQTAPIHLTAVAFNDDILSAGVFPNRELLLTVFDNIKTFEVYKNDIILKSKIDAYYNSFKHQWLDQKKLLQFFQYNDLLDASRDVKLIDYIPELEACRKSLTKQTYNINVE